MNYNTKITPTQGRKVEITITTQQLWKNFIDSWRDIVTDRLANIQRIQSLIAAGVSGGLSFAQASESNKAANRAASQQKAANTVAANQQKQLP